MSDSVALTALDGQIDQSRRATIGGRDAHVALDMDNKDVRGQASTGAEAAAGSLAVRRSA